MSSAAGERPRLIIMGRQGAGKGTQCELLAAHYGIDHMSTGDVLRAAVADGSELGKKAKEFMDAGDLVPDELMTDMVRERLGGDKAAAGFLLDGYPRNVSQAEALVAMMGPGGLHACVNLDVEESIVRERMIARGREDDTPDAIDRRLSLYAQETAPLFDFFDERGLLVVVHGVGEVEEICSRAIATIDGAIAG